MSVAPDPAGREDHPGGGGAGGAGGHRLGHRGLHLRARGRHGDTRRPHTPPPGPRWVKIIL